MMVPIDFSADALAVLVPTVAPFKLHQFRYTTFLFLRVALRLGLDLTGFSLFFNPCAAVVELNGLSVTTFFGLVLMMLVSNSSRSGFTFWSR
jgi:hypothetical protein